MSKPFPSQASVYWFNVFIIKAKMCFMRFEQCCQRSDHN